MRNLFRAMDKYIVAEAIKLMVQNDNKEKDSKILVFLLITFKENYPDVINTNAVDVINNLKSYGTEVTVFDPWASPAEVKHEYDLDTTKVMPKDKYDAIVLTVAHKEFLNLGLRAMLNKNGVLYDVKGILKERVDARL